MTSRTRVLITGGAGLLGSVLCRTAPEWAAIEATIRSNPTPEGVKSTRCDLAQPMAAFELLERRRPALVIHTAYGKTPETMQRDTVDATIELASACAALDIPLIHLSTDAVFSGDASPYDEAAIPAPIHLYGIAKRRAEQAVETACPNACVVRTSLIVSFDPLDAVSAWVAGALKSGETITLFEDEIRMPILVDDLAAMVWELAALSASQRRGVWHLVGPEALSRVQLGELVARYLGLDSSGLQVGSSASSPSPRPRDLRLSSVRAATLSVVPRSLTTVNPHGQAHR